MAVQVRGFWADPIPKINILGRRHHHWGSRHTDLWFVYQSSNGRELTKKLVQEPLNAIETMPFGQPNYPSHRKPTFGRLAVYTAKGLGGLRQGRQACLIIETIVFTKRGRSLILKMGTAFTMEKRPCEQFVTPIKLRSLNSTSKIPLPIEY